MSKKTSLEYVVPSTKIYETSARELSFHALEKLNKFFTNFKKFTGLETTDNPVTMSGDQLRNVPETDRNYDIPKSAKSFRSGFYNSRGHTLKSQIGIFASQALHFTIKKDADSFEKATKKKKNKNFTVLLRKGNVTGAVNMYLAKAKPTKDFWELVNFAKKHGFTVTKRGRF